MKDETIEKVYQIFLKEKSDINEHLPTLRRYAEKCSHVTEFGVRYGRSTVAFLAAKPKKMVSYDIKDQGFPHKEFRKQAAPEIDFQYIVADVLQVKIRQTDLLFIDTLHTKKQLQKELELHAVKARKYIILHDTATYGLKGEDGGPGLIYAISEFLKYNKGWQIGLNVSNNNGLMILERNKI